MALRKQALLVFSKPPIPGLVKTRLTEANGGFLTPEQAADFFKLCLYDVCDASMIALAELQAQKDAAREADPDADEFRYDFFISTTPASNLQLMKETFEKIDWPMEIHYITDSGATFDDHFDDAFKQIFDQGYESIVSVGGDIPTMPKSHVTQAFQWLEYFQDGLKTPGIVLAPCQECGTSLVGFSHDTPVNHQGVYYNLDGTPALDAYMAKIKEHDLPVAYFSPIADIDDKTDLAHAVSCLRAIELAGRYQPDVFVPRRVLSWIGLMGITVSTPPNDEHDPRQYIDNE